MDAVSQYVRESWEVRRKDASGPGGAGWRGRPGAVEAPFGRDADFEVKS